MARFVQIRLSEGIPMVTSPAFLFLVALTAFYLFLAAVIFLKLLWGPVPESKPNRNPETGRG